MPKVSQLQSSCGNLFHTRGAATENVDRQTQFFEVQSAGLESMNGSCAVVGMSVVCRKGTAAGSAFVIEK